MSFPVSIHQDNGHYIATLVGSPDVRVTAPTREAALAEMQIVLDQRFSKGELVSLKVPSEGFLAGAGKYRDDPFLLDICAEIYRERNAEPKE